MQELPSILAAQAIFGLLNFISVKVMQFRCGATGRASNFGNSLQLVLSSLAVPGLRQAMFGRIGVGLLHLSVSTVAFCYLDEVAFLINLVSAMEHVFA